ncbi:unnamed protein product [Adineta steineri]|uniref:Uncharacterized protein n=2 Tax=Adineta steineri TaxID=433720 RepID=A0A818MI37_9BILA|nr:unnamed protein product [Adineta steineri]
MTQIVSSKPYCLENSTRLTRPASETFYRIAGHNVPTIIDKNQAKRLYRLQQAPNLDTTVQLDTSDNDYERQGYFESTVRRHVEESSAQPVKQIFHRPTDMSNASLARFSLGKARLDPHQIIPSEVTTIRNHPTAITMLRHDQGPGGEVVPRFTERLVTDRALRGRLGPGGILNPEEDCREAENYLRNIGRLSAPASLSHSRKHESGSHLSRRDELARRFMYTSTQQAAIDEVPWDSKVPPKLSMPSSTYEVHGSDPVLQSKRLISLQDARTRQILEWDRVQLRNLNFYRKPLENVAPLPRANHISGYSGSIGGDNIQDIDNPTVDFQPYTLVRNEQPKFGINPFKTNIPFYTGKSHWTKTDPVSHYDSQGQAYTTSADYHKPFTVDNTSYRHTDLNGQLSRSVTTVLPQNPFNYMNVISTTTNGSLDTRSPVLIRSLPRSTVSPSKTQKTNDNKEEKPANIQNKE